MIQTISWKEFIEVLLVLSAGYYLVILVLYYRKDIGSLVKGQRLGKSLSTGTPGTKALDSRWTGDPGGKICPEFLLTENMVAELRGRIKKAKDDGVETADLLKAIAHVLRHHVELRNTPYGKAINKFIIRECSSNHSVRLDEHEAMRLWGD
jgi:hypothetical protein